MPHAVVASIRLSAMGLRHRESSDQKIRPDILGPSRRPRCALEPTRVGECVTALRSTISLS